MLFLNGVRDPRSRPVSRHTQLIVVSHQPTAFSYFGVYGLFAIARAIQRELSSVTSADSAVVYLCLDSDDAADRRISHAKVATPWAPTGSVSLSCLESDVSDRPQRLAPAPSLERQNLWLSQITSAYAGVSTRAVRRSKLEFVESLSLIPLTNAAAWQAEVLRRFVESELGLIPIVVNSSQLTHRFPEEVWELCQLRSGADAGSRAKILAPLWSVCPNCSRRCHVEVMTDRTAPARSTCRPCGRDFQVGLEATIPKVALEDLVPQHVLGSLLTLVYAGERNTFASAVHVLKEPVAMSCAHTYGSPKFVSQPR